MVLIMKPIAGWLIIVGVVLLAAGAVAVEHSKVRRLRDDVAAQTTQAQRQQELATENEALRKAQRALAEAAREQDAALATARADLDSVRRTKEALRDRQEIVMMAPQITEAKPQVPLFAAGSIVPADQWKNAGNSTPEAALETVLWAAAGGDVETVAANLRFFNSRDRAAAQTMLDGCPPDIRARYTSPEQLIAALTIPSVTTTEARVEEWTDMNATGAPFPAMKSVMGTFSSSQKPTRLVLARYDDGWKFVVTEGVVARFAAQLKGAQAAAK